MLSNKMTVSLMSLITILVLGLIAMPAFAAKVTIEVKDLDAAADDQKDISFKDGIQAVYGATVTLLVKTDEVFGPAPTVDTTDNTAPGFELVRSLAADDTGIASIARSGDGKQYTVTLTAGPEASAAGNVDTHKVSIYVLPDSLRSITAGESKHNGASITIEFIPADPSPATDGDPDPGIPKVVGDPMRSDGSTHPVFEETVTYIVTLSEEPKTDTFTNDKHPVSVTEASVVSVHFVGSEDADTTADNPDATGGDDKLYKYAVTIKPKYAKTDDIKLTVGHFEDQFGKSTLNRHRETIHLKKSLPSK